jgi:integrase
MRKTKTKTKAKTPHPAKGIYLRNGTYWLNFQRDGVRRFISLETRDFAVAVTRAQRLRYGPELAPKAGLAADIEAFLAHKAKLNIFSKATARINRAVLDELECHVSGVAARDIRASHLAAHYARLQKRLKETSAQIHMRALRSFFSWCVETRRTAENPAKAVKLARVDQPARIRFCTKAERDMLIADAPTDDLRFILLMGFHCGMRKGEIIEARAGWFTGGTVFIENTDSFRIKDRDARHIPLTEPVKEFLAGYLTGKDRAVFALKPGVKHGRGTYRYDFHRPFNDYLLAKGMRWVTAHVMRHTFASLLVQAGVSIFKVARWLGDGVEVVEKHYAHLAPQDADIDRMV